VFWIDASSTGSITQGLKGICNLPAAQTQPLDGSPESALSWIGSLRDNYAIIFDNADALTPEELEGYFPPGLRGNILITSRNSAMQRLTSPENSYEVGEMEEDDAILLLLKAACLDTSRTDFQDQASEIVKELFRMPLAVDQAGAYISSGATKIGDYLSKYRQHREALLSHPEFKGASKYNRNVYGTWELSYQEIKRRTGSADLHEAKAAETSMHILAVFVFFHHDGIMKDIFSYATIPQHWRNRDEDDISGLPCASALLDHTLLPLNEDGTWDNYIFDEGIRMLLSFCLVKHDSYNGVYAVHPLIHAWGRDRMSLDDRKWHWTQAFATLLCSLHHNFESQPYSFRRALVTHVRENMHYGGMANQEEADTYFDDASAGFGKLFLEQGYLSEAEKLEQQVLDTRKRILGTTHIDTIMAAANLARTYKALGKFGEAEKLESHVLDAWRMLLGEKHRYTLTAMGNLAVTYCALGKYAEAEKLEMKVLKVRSSTLGEEHSGTIQAMANLAGTFKHLGKYSEVEKMEIQVLNARKSAFGENHPDTIIAMENLAGTYKTFGRYTEAEKLQIQVLDANTKICGKEHPNTIRAMGNLAGIVRSLGKYSEAVKLYIQVLKMRNHMLGENHPDTVTTMANLSVAYLYQGKYTEAEKLQIDVLNACKRNFGDGHPHSIMAMANLGSTLEGMGRYSEALELNIQVFQARDNTLGKEHPKTIDAMSNLAATYHTLGEYRKAEKLQIQASDLSIRILGAEHPDTIIRRSNLASIYGKLGKHTEAEELKIQVLESSRRLLGEEHPDTLINMGNLAATYNILGKYEEAEKLEIQVLDLNTRILGAEHPSTVHAMANLADSFRDLKKYSEAEKLQIQVLDFRKRILGEEHPNTQEAIAKLAITQMIMSKDIRVEDSDNLTTPFPSDIDTVQPAENNDEPNRKKKKIMPNLLRKMMSIFKVK
jgi:tetratricopeptide (TPR) repeat protein